MEKLKKFYRSFMLTGLLGIVVMGSMALCVDPFEDGYWTNTDPNTNGITHAYVKFFCNDVILNGVPPGPDYTMRLWGACSPWDCDWGEVEGERIGDWVYGFYDHGFAKRYVWIKESTFVPGQLYMHLRTDFVDPNRNDYILTHRFTN